MSVFDTIYVKSLIQASNVTASSLTVDQININDSNVTYTGTTGNNKSIIPINLANGYIITDNTNDYIQIVSTTGSPEIKLLQNTNVTGTLTTTGLVNGRNMTTDGTDLDSVILTGIQALTATEVDQLENINTVTISNTQWGYLGASDQAIATTDIVTFAQLTVDQFSIDNSTLTFTGTTTANIITAPDNLADGLRFNDAGGANYIRLITTNGDEKVEILQDVCFRECILLTDIAEPPNPADGSGKLYKKTGEAGLWWLPDSGGSPLDITAGSDRDIQTAESSVTTSTTSTTYVDLNSMTLTTVNTETREYLVLFSAEFSSSFAGRTIFIVVNVDGADVSTTVRRINYSNSGKFQVSSTIYRTSLIGNGIIIKIRWHYENSKQLDCLNRILIIDGAN